MLTPSGSRQQQQRRRRRRRLSSLPPRDRGAGSSRTRRAAQRSSSARSQGGGRRDPWPRKWQLTVKMEVPTDSDSSTMVAPMNFSVSGRKPQDREYDESEVPDCRFYNVTALCYETMLYL